MARIKTPENAVIIKGGLDGAVVVLDDQYRMSTIFNMVEKRVRQNKEFFSQGTITINLNNRLFTSLEFGYIKHLLLFKYGVSIRTDTLSDQGTETDDEKRADLFPRESLIHESPKPLPDDGCKVVKHTLRAGQYAESNGDIVIIGDVNPGAEVKAGKNVFVYGILRGRVEAGASGDLSAYIVALDFEPVQLKIGDKIATSPAGGLKRELRPQKAFIHEDSIVVEFLR
ncbi:MAG: septum site-determining protein MinC [Caldisericia bacterium]|nr:septum site-determining protein MinC [Caldisericia bacterium]